MRLILIGVVVLLVLGIGVGGAVYWYQTYDRNDTAIVAQNTATSTLVVEEETIDPKDLVPEALTLATTTVVLSDGVEQTFRIPEGWEINVAADELGKARFMTMTPDGQLFVPDMVDYQLARTAKMYVLSDFDSETGTFGSKNVYLENLQGVNDVDFYEDADGKQWIYVAETAYLKRYPYEPGDTTPSGPAEIVTTFPAQQSPGEVSVVWHITRTVEFVGDQMYITVGSGCNSCEELNGERAMIEVMDADGENMRAYATGLRNSVGLEWARDQLYVTVNGVDHLGPDAPNEALFAVVEGADYAWPYCYLEDGEWRADTSQVWQRTFDCAEEAPEPLAVFPPRSAALGITYFDETSHATLRNSFLVALHGSFEAWMMSGYQIIRVEPDGTQEVFMDGFQLPDATRVARPMSFVQYDENSFFFTDDHGGRIYFMRGQ